MSEEFDIAIVGSGPSGLSAAARAAQKDISHILLETTDHASDTIFKFQKRKFVMATPDVMPLRSDTSFAAGTREEILDKWDEEIEQQKINISYNSEVTGISGEKGNFTLEVKGGRTIKANHIVLSIGMQGNLRKLDVEGDDWEFVQYQLDDPEEYEDETIIVVGAGDAAIENAVALAAQNRVALVNRKGEFARIKAGNLTLITEAIDLSLIHI